jgi:hypothetical protein
MIFCAIPMTENWPFFAYDDRKFAALVLDGYRRQHFFSVGGVHGVEVWGSGGVGVWAVWAVWGCGVTPYVRHSTDCTCCDFGHLRFYKKVQASKPDV